MDEQYRYDVVIERPNGCRVIHADTWDDATDMYRKLQRLNPDKILHIVPINREHRPMTYTLVRHVIGWGEDSILYTAESTPEAIRIGQNLHAPRALADYAQIKDHTGRVIATLPGNQSIEKAHQEYEQLQIKFTEEE